MNDAGPTVQLFVLFIISERGATLNTFGSHRLFIFCRTASAHFQFEYFNAPPIASPNKLQIAFFKNSNSIHLLHSPAHNDPN